MDFFSCDICKELLDIDEVNLCENCESKFCKECHKQMCGYCKKCNGKINLTK